MNIDKNYKLYKLIFNNIVLVKKIYKIVRGINKQITNSNLNNKSFYRICKYDEATFYWCIKNKHFKLIYDKIKIGTIFKEIDLGFDNLLKFIQSFKKHQIDQQDEINLLNKFFNINKSILLNINYSNKETNFIELNSLLSFSIYSQNLNFVKTIYNGMNCKIIIKEGGGESSPNDLLELAIKMGNLEIIEYCYKTIGIKLKLDIKNIDKVISYTLFSDNRDLVLELFLFNYLNENNYGDGNDDDIINYKAKYLFSNKFKLSNFTNFKQLYQKFGYLMKYDIKEHFNISKDIIEKIIENKERINQETTSIEILNFLKISLFLISNQPPPPPPPQPQPQPQQTAEIEKLKIKSNQLIKKLNHLIEFNNTKDELLIEIYNKEKEEEEPPPPSTTSKTKKISNIFKSSKKKNKQPQQKKVYKFDEIMYNDFNLNREVFRLFIFDYLKLIIKFGGGVGDEINLTNEKIDILISEFSSLFNQHNVIKEYIESKNQDINLGSFKLCLSILSIAFKNLDSKLIDILPEIFNCKELSPHINLNPINLLNKNKSQKLPKHHIKDIEKKIQVIKSFFKLDKSFVTNDKYHGKHLREIKILRSFFKNNKEFINQQHADEIAKLILDTNKSKSISPLVFSYNFEIFKYYYENYNQLFEWNSYSDKMIENNNNNLEFLQYCYDNDIGSIRLGSYLEHSNSRIASEYMYNTFGLKYTTIESLKKISLLDDWDSNYLFNFSITKLVEEFKQIDTLENQIEIGTSWTKNFNHWQSIINSGLLHFCHFISDDLKSFFYEKMSYFNSLDLVIQTTFNKNTIKRFLKQINEKNQSRFYLELSYKMYSSLKKENYNQQFDFILKNKFIKK